MKIYLIQKTITNGFRLFLWKKIQTKQTLKKKFKKKQKKLKKKYIKIKKRQFKIKKYFTIQIQT